MLLEGVWWVQTSFRREGVEEPEQRRDFFDSKRSVAARGCPIRGCTRPGGIVNWPCCPSGHELCPMWVKRDSTRSLFLFYPFQQFLTFCSVWLWGESWTTGRPPYRRSVASSSSRMYPPLPDAERWARKAEARTPCIARVVDAPLAAAPATMIGLRLPSSTIGPL